MNLDDFKALLLSLDRQMAICKALYLSQGGLVENKRKALERRVDADSKAYAGFMSVGPEYAAKFLETLKETDPVVASRIISTRASDITAPQSAAAPDAKAASAAERDDKTGVSWAEKGFLNKTKAPNATAATVAPAKAGRDDKSGVSWIGNDNVGFLNKSVAISKNDRELPSSTIAGSNASPMLQVPQNAR